MTICQNQSAVSSELIVNMLASQEYASARQSLKFFELAWVLMRQLPWLLMG